MTKLSGIWFEYLITEGAKENYTYDCASWLMMYDKLNDTSLTVMHTMQVQGDSDSTRVLTFPIDCQASQYPTNTAVCYYNKVVSGTKFDEIFVNRPRTMSIISTDYYSYLVA